MDFGKAYSFIREDEGWVGKITIGSIIFLLAGFFIIPIPLLIGYQIAVTRNVMKGVEKPLPEWQDWGQLFMDGLWVGIAFLVYTLPLWLLYCAGFAVFLLPAFIGGGTGSEEIAAILVSAGFVAWAVTFCLLLLFVIVLYLVAPAVFIQYART
ncbi:MAG: DUF4013 domain-containing protein, partial [Chloroflexi bacterium]|nr:DUF4013 domain-containing protein [Chloroflexota bacterium]